MFSVWGLVWGLALESKLTQEMLFDDDLNFGYDEAMVHAFHRELDVWRNVRRSVGGSVG